VLTSKLLCVALLTIIDPLGNLSEILVRERGGRDGRGVPLGKMRVWVKEYRRRGRITLNFKVGHLMGKLLS